MFLRGGHFLHSLYAQDVLLLCIHDITTAARPSGDWTLIAMPIGWGRARRSRKRGGLRFFLGFALSNPRANWQLLIRSGAWRSAVERRRGRAIPAQAIGLGQEANPFQRLSPEGAIHDLASIPHVWFVVLNPVPLQKLPIFHTPRMSEDVLPKPDIKARRHQRLRSYLESANSLDLPRPSLPIPR